MLGFENRGKSLNSEGENAMMLRRHLYRRYLGIALVLLAAAGVCLYVGASIFNFSSLAATVMQWIYWGLWGTLGILCLATLMGRRRPSRTRREASDQALNQINDLYLGRKNETFPEKTLGSYSVYPTQNPESEGESPNRALGLSPPDEPERLT